MTIIVSIKVSWIFLLNQSKSIQEYVLVKFKNISLIRSSFSNNTISIKVSLEFSSINYYKIFQKDFL